MKKLTRDIEISEMTFDDSTLTLSFASSAPYLRENKKYGEYLEVLEISENAIDFVRLVDNRCPLLLEHDPDNQIGVVEKAWIENEKLYCSVRFSDSEEAQQIKSDIESGIRRNTSIGYNVKEYEKIPGNPPTFIAKKWLPIEVSVVSIPADPNVGYMRSIENPEEENMEEETKETKAEETKEETKACEETAEETAEKSTKECEETAEEEKKETCPECGNETCSCEEDKKKKECEEAEAKKAAEIEEIRSLGELLDRRELAENFIADNRSYKEFKEELKTLNVKKEIKTMSETVQKFSLRKAILNAAGRMSNEEAAFEREINVENKKMFADNSVQGDNVIVLTSKEIRAFDGTEALNQVEYRPGMYASPLRPPVTVDYLGIQKIGVPDGRSVSFAVSPSGIYADYVGLNDAVPSGAMDFELKQLNPKKEGAFVQVSYQSLLQDNPGAEGIIMNDIVKALDQAKDNAFWNGSSANHPSGLLTIDGVNEVTVPATPTLSTALEFEKKIRESYDYSGDLKWVMGTGTYYKWASTPYSATEQNRMLVEDRKCIGYDVYVDPNMPASGIVLGNFNEALEAEFEGITLQVSRDFTLDTKGMIAIIARRANDFCFRRLKSFCKGV